jgi:hypothetical protein
MKYEWRAAQTAMPEPGHVIDQVLVELESPILVTEKDARGNLWIGLSVDRDKEVERWLEALTSVAELEMLARNKIPMRALFDPGKDFFLIDRRHGEEVAISKKPIDYKDIPPRVLPVRGAPLPDVCRTLLIDALNIVPMPKPVPLLRFLGSPIVNASAPFALVSELMSGFQRLWTSIIEWSAPGLIAFLGKTHDDWLFHDGVVNRSLGLVVRAKANHDLFTSAAETYRKLADCAALNGEAPAINWVPHGTPIGVRIAFVEHCKTLRSWNVEAISELGGAPAFIGHAQAKRVTSLQARQQLMLPTAEELGESNTFRGRGYFASFSLNGARYVFVEQNAGVERSGTLPRGLIDLLIKNRQAIAVGPGSLYEIEARRDNRRSNNYRLSEVRELEAPVLFRA